MKHLSRMIAAAILITGLSWLFPGTTAAAAPGASQPPHIVVVLAEDLGIQGAPDVATPHLDSLAKRRHPLYPCLHHLAGLLTESRRIAHRALATIIWCNTTPVPNDSGETSGRRKDEDLIYNKAALEVVSRYPEILVTDLNKAVRSSPAFDEWRKGNNVHFRSETELKALGEAVAATVRQAIK